MIHGEDGPEELIDLLVHETNRYARQHLQSHPDLPPHSRGRNWRPVSAEEMKAFLGLLLAMGLAQKPTIASYWNDGPDTWLTHTPTFGQVMPRNRFQAILRYLHCSNNDDVVQRGEAGYDPLHKIVEALDIFNWSFQAFYV